VSGLEEHATDEAYQEPDVTVPYDPGQPGQAEPLPPISPASLAAHADEEPYVEPDLTRPYGPEVEEVLAQEKRAESPRPRFPSVGPLVPEPLEPPVKEKKPDDAYLSIELKDEPEE
jgi:hypothetical protein